MKGKPMKTFFAFALALASVPAFAQPKPPQASRTVQAIPLARVGFAVLQPKGVTTYGGCQIHLSSEAKPTTIVMTECTATLVPHSTPPVLALSFILPAGTPAGKYLLTWAIVDQEYPTMEPDYVQVVVPTK